MFLLNHEITLAQSVATCLYSYPLFCVGMARHYTAVRNYLAN